MPTKIVYFLAGDVPTTIEDAELEHLTRSLQVTVMNASANVEYGETDRILPCDYVAGTIPPEYAHIPVYDPSTTPGGPIYITDIVGLEAELDSKADKPIDIEDVVGLQTELDSINLELDSAATLPIAISDVTGLQSALNSKATKPVPITDVSGLQAELDSKAELPIAISDVTGLQAELDSVASLPIAISDVTGLQTELDEKATLTELQTVADALDGKADSPIQIQDVEGLETELDSVATLPIAISDVTGLQEALDSAGSLPIEISDVTGLQAALDAPVPISDVTGLQTALDAKADLTDLDPILLELATKQDAPVAISDVTGLQDALDAVATLPIEISDVTGLQAELDSVASLPIAISDVTGLQTALDAPVAISEVTGLQTALDAKADLTDLDPILLELATKADAPVLIADVTGLQVELDSKAELPIEISDVNGLQAELDAVALLPINISDVTGLQTELDSKAELPVAIAEVSGLQTELDGKADSVHGHAIADVTGLQTELDAINTELDSVATLPITIADVTGLQTELDSKIVAPVPISDVSGLQTELDAKADLADLDPILADLANKAELPITIADVTNLQIELNSKAPISHGHAMADVSGLVAELDAIETEIDGKAATVHGHAIADVTGLQSELNGKAPTVHGHAITDTTGLQTALDDKSATTHGHAVATTSADGFFSKTDKEKLDNVATGATAITFPAANAAGTLANGAPQPSNAGADVLAARSDHQHPLASAANAGLMSIADWTKLDSVGEGGSSSGIDTTTRTVYVSATGNNANDGLTSGTAKLDFAGIWTLLPATLGAPFIVNVTGIVNYIEPPSTTKAIGTDGYICIIGIGETIVASGAVGATSTHYNQIDGTAFGAIEAWTGAALVMKTGLSIGIRRTILRNTTTSIKFSYGLTNAAGSRVYAQAGDTFDIVRPVSVIKLPAPPNALINDIPIHFTNIIIDAVTPVSLANGLRKIAVSQQRITSVMIGVEWKCQFYYVQNINIVSIDIDSFTFAKFIGPIMVSMGYSETDTSKYASWGISVTIAQNILISNAMLFCTLTTLSNLNTYSESHVEGYFRIRSLTAKLKTAAIIKMGVIVNDYGNGIYLSGNAYVEFTGLIVSMNYTNSSSNQILLMDNSVALLKPWSNLTADAWNHGNSGPVIEVKDNASLQLAKGFVLNMSDGLTSVNGLKLSGNANVQIGTLKYGTQYTTCLVLQDNSRLFVETLIDLYQSTADVPCVIISDNAQMTIGSAGALTARNASVTQACVFINGGKLIHRNAAVSSFSATNVNATGTPIGLWCTQGGHAHIQCNPIITSSYGGTAGFGVSCRGGGRFTCATQPTGVAGAVADFTIGPAVGDQFADTALAVSYSHVTLGMSSVQRTA